MPSPKVRPSTPLIRVRLVRQWLGLTQRGLAARLGCSQPAVAQIEAGTANPSPRVKARLIRLVVPRLGNLLFGLGEGESDSAHRKADTDDR